MSTPASLRDDELAFDPAASPELVALGRRVYMREGCINCHSQFVRPGGHAPAAHDDAWWGPWRTIDRSQRPPLIGNRRQGPDLLNVGNRRSATWHRVHLVDPRLLSPGSRMPSYRHLFDSRRETTDGDALVAYLSHLGFTSRLERHARAEIAPVPALSGDPRAGARLFERHCAPCHGLNARGDGPLSRTAGGPFTGLAMNLRKPTFWLISWGEDIGSLQEGLARVIRFGIPDTSMPGHETLTDQAVSDLVSYVMTLPAVAHPDAQQELEAGP
jgi:cytochrome c oxidase cbb3-type subunit 2